MPRRSQHHNRDAVKPIFACAQPAQNFETRSPWQLYIQKDHRGKRITVAIIKGRFSSEIGNSVIAVRKTANPHFRECLLKSALDEPRVRRIIFNQENYLFHWDHFRFRTAVVRSKMYCLCLEQIPHHNDHPCVPHHVLRLQVQYLFRDRLLCHAAARRLERYAPDDASQYQCLRRERKGAENRLVELHSRSSLLVRCSSGEISARC